MSNQLSPNAALLLAAITVSAVDGDLSAHEVAIINRLDGFTTSSDWDSAIAVWNETPLEDCVAVVAANLNTRQQRITMANLIDIAMADGTLHGDENTLLRAYASAFEVADSEIEKMVDVITLKNDKTGF